MNNQKKRSSLAALAQGALGGLQWRLALLWILITLLPTAVAALPLWRALDQLLGRSVHADAWAVHFDGLMFGDTYNALTTNNAWTGMTLVAGVLVTLAVAPFLTGMVVAGGRANRALGFGGLLQGGATEYGRMLRLGILAWVPYALFIAAAFGMSSFADDKVDTSLLASRAEMVQHAALGLSVFCLVVAQSIVESARAQFIADIGLRSAFVALGRGFMQCVRRPFATLVVFAIVTGVGMALLTAIASWRGHTTATGGGLLAGFLIVQLGVVVVAWMRTARLLALSGLAAVSAQRRRRTDFASAL